MANAKNQNSINEERSKRIILEERETYVPVPCEYTTYII
jgi:hypothetical protein